MPRAAQEMASPTMPHHTIPSTRTWHRDATKSKTPPTSIYRKAKDPTYLNLSRELSVRNIHKHIKIEMMMNGYRSWIQTLLRGAKQPPYQRIQTLFLVSSSNVLPFGKRLVSFVFERERKETEPCAPQKDETVPWNKHQHSRDTYHLNKCIIQSDPSYFLLTQNRCTYSRKASVKSKRLFNRIKWPWLPPRLAPRMVHWPCHSGIRLDNIPRIVVVAFWRYYCLRHCYCCWA